MYDECHCRSELEEKPHGRAGQAGLPFGHAACGCGRTTRGTAGTQRASVTEFARKADQAAQTGYVTRETCTNRSKIEPSKRPSVPDRSPLDKPPAVSAAVPALFTKW
ncbi:hypothetical protein MYA_1858 [Burkholderia stabilis]|nr:hypothetical protein MYA_1858 [Burkholderia stabilis]